MAKYNVKKIENTNTITTTLCTSCKKRDTAISRFFRFLSEYDSCFKDSMILCTMKIEFVGYVDSNVLYQSTVETDEYYMTYTECGDDYHITIEFKHDENTTHYKSLANTSVSNRTLAIKHDFKVPDTIIWCICTQDGVIKDFTDRKELFKYAYDNNLVGDFEHVWIEEKELRDRTHKYYETVDYETLDLYHVRSMLEFDICDMKINDNSVTTEEQSEHEQTEETTEEATEEQTENTTTTTEHYFSGVKMAGTTAQIKYATDILNDFYKNICSDIEFEYKLRVDDIDVENKDFYANLTTYVTILEKVLTGSHARDVIRSKDKFEVWGNIYRTATNFIVSYSADKPNWVIKHLENKIRKELLLF